MLKKYTQFPFIVPNYTRTESHIEIFIYIIYIILRYPKLSSNYPPG